MTDWPSIMVVVTKDGETYRQNHNIIGEPSSYEIGKMLKDIASFSIDQILEDIKHNKVH